MKQHPCTLVPRALWPRWDRKERLASTLDFCQAIGADEIMLFPTGQLVSPGHLEGKMHVQRMQALKRAMVEAKRRGIAVMVNDWAMLDDFGHAQGTHQEKMWPWAVDITLTPAIGYCCMLSPKVQQKAIDALLSLAKVGVRKVFLDDEIRHDWHPAANRKEGAHYCFCDLHMREFARWQGSKSGKGIAAAEMAKRLQSDKPEDAALRRQWIAFKRDMLLNFIHKVRSVVHAKVPDFRIGQMATFIHFQTLGGVGFGEQGEAVHDLGEALDFIQLALQLLAARGGQGGILQRGLEFGMDDGQGRLEFVRGVEGELAHALESIVQARRHCVEDLGQAVEFIAALAARQRFAEIIGLNPFGALLAGAIARAHGAPVAVTLGGAICLVATLVALRLVPLR